MVPSAIGNGSAHPKFWSGLAVSSGASSESMHRLGRREHRQPFVTRAYALVTAVIVHAKRAVTRSYVSGEVAA